jgi:carbon-monoxide dehydrogenase medium subunit
VCTLSKIFIIGYFFIRKGKGMLKDHLFPETLGEALAVLEEYKGRARLIAGGTDLIVDIRRKEFDFNAVVDIEKIDELRSIRKEGGKILIGSGVTFTELEENELIRNNALALAQAAGQVGSPQIRNRGTIGGNIVSAQPAADGALALFAFDAVLKIAGEKGVHEIPITQAYLEVGKSIIDPSKEILVGIQIEKRKKGEGSNYQRIAIRKAMALPILACGISIKAIGREIQFARISIGPVSNTPFRAARAEDFLKGKPLKEEVFQEAGKIVSEEVDPRDSKLRGSGVYRKYLAAVIVRRGLERAAAETS